MDERHIFYYYLVPAESLHLVLNNYVFFMAKLWSKATSTNRQSSIINNQFGCGRRPALGFYL